MKIPQKNNSKKYTQNEETINATTHGVGIVLGVTAGIWLIQKAFYGDVWAVSSVSVYVVCMLFSYFASTIYHACRNETRKATLRKYDHIAIYFHIAGTYTFFLLAILRNVEFWGWLLFFVIWIVALVGSYISFKGKGMGNKIETVCYVAMGLVIFVAFKPLFDTLHSMNALSVFWYIILGGVFYILGALLYSFKKIPYMHSVFHIFVIGGSICHIWAIAVALEKLVINN